MTEYNENTGFSGSELQLSYTKFKALADSRKSTLDDEVKKWLWEWDRYDFATSPRDDDERRLIRYGHFLGYFAALEAV